MEAVASRLEATASRLEAVASRLEATASGLEAVASRLEATASGLEDLLYRCGVASVRSARETPAAGATAVTPGIAVAATGPTAGNVASARSGTTEWVCVWHRRREHLLRL